MSVISTGDFAKAVAPQVPKWFGMGYKRFPEVFREIFKVENTDQAVEEDVLVSGLGLMNQTSEGESTPYDRMKQVYVARYMPADFRLGVIITKNMIADGKGVKILEQRSKALGVAYKETLDILAHNVLNRAFNASYVGADGVSLISASHPTSSGVTLSNKPSVDADLSENALEQMYIDLGSFVDDRGLKISVMPRKLVIPRASVFEAQRILKGTERPSTANRDINALNSLSTIPDILVSDYLTDSDSWYVLTSEDEQGLKMLFRQELELSDDTHFDTDNSKFKGHCRVIPGFTDPRCIYGCQGA